MRDINDIIDQLERLGNDLARAAQDVYDDWDQVDGYSDAYGTGGICDDVAAEMASIITRKFLYVFNLTIEFGNLSKTKMIQLLFNWTVTAKLPKSKFYPCENWTLPL